LIDVDGNRLLLFSQLYDQSGTPAEEARLPVVHSEEVVAVLEKLSTQNRRLGDNDGAFYSTVMFDETYAQQEGLIRKATEYPKDVTEWILSGPHFFVGCPLNKTPNEQCAHNQDYSDIDLLEIPDSYLPRTNFLPACPPDEYRRRMPSWQEKPAVGYHRVIARTMIVPTNERTLVTALLPPGPAHIDGCFSLAFQNAKAAVQFGWLCASLPFDFFVKTTGKTHFRRDLAALLPLPEVGNLAVLAVSRFLSLSCVVQAYAATWNLMSESGLLGPIYFTRLEARLRPPAFSPTWVRSVALRTDYVRRQAIVELDTLASIALGLTEEEPITIYRVQFPVLRQYERDNLYDQVGRFVPKGVLELASRHSIDIHQPLSLPSFRGPAEVVGEVETPGLGVTGGIVWEDPKMEPRMKRVYPPPFTKCDREADMRQAYRAFQERIRSQETVK
jgi:hypothetical protein